MGRGNGRTREMRKFCTAASTRHGLEAAASHLSDTVLSTLRCIRSHICTQFADPSVVYRSHSELREALARYVSTQ